MSSSSTERVIALIDMDCFYVQVEERDNPQIKGRPAAVVQYNTHRGGGIIAVNYEARACGVKRGMRGAQAQELCPDISLIRVPTLRNKANLQKYRNASKEVFYVLCGYSDTVERASIDEAYLDLTRTVNDKIALWQQQIHTQCDEFDTIKQELEGCDLSQSASTASVTCKANGVIPTLESLKATWVYFSEEFVNGTLIYDLAVEENRKEYELNDTLPSNWSPVDITAVRSVDAKEGESDVVCEAGISVANETIGTSATERSVKEREAERIKGLSAWLLSLNRKFGSSSATSWLDSTTDPIGGHSTTDDLCDLRLAVAAQLVQEIRAAVLRETGFKCSAGIAHNKVLAKLVCGLHKPNQQTIIPQKSVPSLWENTAVHKVRNLGGKLGDSLKTDFGCATMADLSKLTLAQLQRRYDDKTAHWLHGLGRGIDNEAVVSRQLPKSVGCSKNFLGPESLHTRAQVEQWTRALSEELAERLQEDQSMHKRLAKTLTVGLRQGNPVNTSASTFGSRACPLPSYAPEKIACAAMSLISASNMAKQRDTWSPPVLNISLSASKFEDSVIAGMQSVFDMFKKAAEKRNKRAVEAVTTQPSTSSKYFGTDLQKRNDDCVNESLPCPALKTKGIMCERLDSSSMSLNTDSPAGAAEKDTDENTQTKSSGNSFFKKILQKKQRSGLNHEANTEHETVPKPSSSYSTTNTEDSCDTVLNMLVERLEDDSNDKIWECSPELQNAPLRFNKKSSACTDNSKSRVQEPHFFTHKVTKNGSTRTENLRQSSTQIEIEEPVSVTELFPDLDAVDKDLLQWLPLKLRKAVQEALKKHNEEKKVNKSQSCGIWKFVKSNQQNEREQTSSGSSLVNNETLCNQHNGGDKSNLMHKRKYASLGFSLDGTQSPSTSHQPSKEYVTPNSERSNNFGTPYKKPTSKKTPNLLVGDEIASTSAENDDSMVCTKCSKIICISEVAEHADFHMALDMQEKLQRSEEDGRKASFSAKRKSSSDARVKAKKKTSKTVQTLDGYFKK